MEIRMCKNPRGLPPETEVREIVRLLCNRTGLDFDRVRLHYITGGRRNKQSSKGIKLARPSEWSVQLFIGGSDETVECYFSITLGGGKSRSGYEVFEVLNKACPNRVFSFTEEVMKQSRLVKATQPAHVGNNGAAEHHHDEPAEVPTPPPSQPLLIPDEPEVVVSPAQPEQEYDRYFDDPAKLHLTACALVMLTDEDCERPFSFDLFERALQDSNVPESAGLPMSLMRAFLSRDYMVRINPGSSPSRYTITKALVAFALGPVPKQTVLLKSKQGGQSGDGRLNKLAQQRIAKLHQIHEDYERDLVELKKQRSKLAELRKLNIVDKGRNIDGEMRSLRRRLEALEAEKKTLAKSHEEVKVVHQFVTDLEKKVNNPVTMLAIREFNRMNEPQE